MIFKLYYPLFILFLAAFIDGTRKPKCSKNMIAKKCPVCTNTCSFTKSLPSRPVKKCYKKNQCKINKYTCVCKKGFYLSAKNKCVKRKDCSKNLGTTKKPVTTTRKCSKNEFWTNCKSACEEKCSDDNKKPCPYKCNGRGCQCKPLYLRDDVTGKCVKREECTKTTTLLPTTTRRCKMNEYFTLCGSACEPRCSDYNKINNWCTLQCVIGCECYKGFVRNDYTNECIRSSECPIITTRRPPTKQCDANSTFNTCKSPCPDKCSEKPSKIKICTRNCAGIGCECLRGYVINDVGGDGKCILRKDCPVATTSSPETTPRCPKNMVYTDCKSACEPRCGISLETSGICTMECAGKGCECRAPFALNDHGECVEREKCKKSPSGGYYIIHLLRKTITSMYTLIFKH